MSTRARLARSLLSLLVLAGSASAKRVEVRGRQLLLDGQPFEVRGICYSPTPINASVHFAPYGDYFTADFSFIWLRDLRLIKAMGANMLRVYGWLPENDHSDFLDAVEAHGLKLMATFYMGEASESPVETEEQRGKVVRRFAEQVRQYRDHPALIMWSFGNELNGVWNGYLQQLGHNPAAPCAWDERYDDLGGCWIHKGKPPVPGSQCYNTSYCVYSRLFGLINQAAEAAKAEADVLIVSAMADVDALYEKVARAGHLAPSLDAWTAQVYRGNTFGDFFGTMSDATDKPVLLTEYGVDAYHDVCGTQATTPCYNRFGDESGSYVDEAAQADYALKLTREIQSNSSLQEHCGRAKRGSTDEDGYPNCATVGGFLMSWVDEYWKGATAQAKCAPTYDDPDFSVATCDDHAHVTCGNWNASDHDLCGYKLDAAPDGYVNEEWFGITTPTTCGDNINAIAPRDIFWQMRHHWTGAGKEPSLFGSCETTLSEKCAARELPTGLPFLPPPPPPSGGHCSLRGQCVTDHRICGPGDVNSSVTPCCACDSGFAGSTCEQLDARTYLALGAGSVLVGLLVLLAITTVVGKLFRAESAARAATELK